MVGKYLVIRSIISYYDALDVQMLSGGQIAKLLVDLISSAACYNYFDNET
jgi:hypothetical protein